MDHLPSSRIKQHTAMQPNIMSHLIINTIVLGLKIKKNAQKDQVLCVKTIPKMELQKTEIKVVRTGKYMQ